MSTTSSTLRRLTRLVLVWYVQGEGGDAQVRSSMDCPLCAHATPALPPPTVAALAHVADVRSHIVQRLPEAVLIARTAPPLPSRGPPELN